MVKKKRIKTEKALVLTQEVRPPFPKLCGNRNCGLKKEPEVRIKHLLRQPSDFRVPTFWEYGEHVSVFAYLQIGTLKVIP